MNRKRLIDADAVKKELQEWAVNLNNSKVLVKADAEFIIDNAPTIDAVPVKHGRWIDRGTVCQRYECSVCGDQHDWLILPNNINFCPNCGADMRGGAE